MMKNLVKLILLTFIIKNNLMYSAKPFLSLEENKAVLQAKMILDLNRLLEKIIREKNPWIFSDIIQELKNSPILFDKLAKEDREKYLSLLTREVKKLNRMFKGPRTIKEWTKISLLGLAALTPLAAIFGVAKYNHRLRNNHHYYDGLLFACTILLSAFITPTAVILGINNLSRFDLEIALNRLKYIKSLFVIYDRECQLKESLTA